MNCINTICLYLKKYLTDEQFENIFYDYIEDFQNSLEEDMYLNVYLQSLVLFKIKLV